MNEKKTTDRTELFGEASIAAIYISCPECGSDLVDPQTGSHLITGTSCYAEDMSAGEVVQCQNCGCSYRLPGLLRQL